MVVLATQQRLGLDFVHLAQQLVQRLVGLGQQIVVALFTGHLVGERRVLEVLAHILDRVGLGLDELELAHDGLGLLLVVPEVGLAHLVLKLFQSVALVFIVKESHGSLQSAPLGR